MKAEKFAEILNDIDGEFVIKAHTPRGKGKILSPKKWFALAASLVLIGITAVAVTAKPEYRIRFEETEFEEGTAYSVCAETEKFPLSAFSENTKNIGKEIIQQHGNYEPYMSSLPDHWYRHFGSAAEAEDFIGFKRFSVPDWNIPEKDFSVYAFGDFSGKISRIGIEYFYLDNSEDYLGVQISADALTENSGEEDFQFNIISSEEYKTLREYKNEKGTHFYIFEGEKSLAGNSRITIYFIKDGVLYFGNFAFNEEKTDEAKKLIEEFILFY